MDLQELLNSEETQIKKLQEIVEASIREEQNLTLKILEAERDRIEMMNQLTEEIRLLQK